MQAVAAQEETPIPSYLECDQVAARPARPRFVSGEPVEIKSGDHWHKGRYKAYSSQYDYHMVALSDGSGWTGTSDEIRSLGDEDAVDR